MYGIANLTLLGILLWHQLVSYIATKIAVIAQYRSCHTTAKLGVNLTHQNGWLTKRLGHPACKARILTRVLIIYPQVPRPGHGVIATAKQRSVGLGSQGGLELNLGILQVGVVSLNIVFLRIVVGYLGKSRKELLAFRDILCH